jgi:glyoxylase-like metal-dependent hydrolase (beta-lactamase superfamily II)
MPGGFTFNQFLVVDEAPLLFHTGQRRIFPLVKAAVDHVLGSADKLGYVGFSHFEADECGALNDWLEVAPRAEAVCSQIAAMTSVSDFGLRPPRPLADLEELSLGKKRVRWLDAPHLPHNWECGYLFEVTERTLLCGDILTHGGADVVPLTESDVVGPAVGMWKAMPSSIAIEQNTRTLFDKLARTEPKTLALMHGSSFRGDGAKVLRELASALGV